MHSVRGGENMMSPEEFDFRGRQRRRWRARRRREAFWSWSGTIAGAAIWAFVICMIVWGVMR